jgi:hypothetical protein
MGKYGSLRDRWVHMGDTSRRGERERLGQKAESYRGSETQVTQLHISQWWRDPTTAIIHNEGNKRAITMRGACMIASLKGSQDPADEGARIYDLYEES